MPFHSLLRRFAQTDNPLVRAGIAPGLYPYRCEAGGTVTRFYLRVDRDGQGVLLVNATAAARLTPSGIVIAKGLLEGEDREEILTKLAAGFRGVKPQEAERDVESVQGVLSTLASPGDNYPILNLPDPAFVPEAALLDKPLSADVPLAEAGRLLPILGRLWEEGIPHVTFLVGENPVAADLVRVVERAEDLGMIAGVRARGSDLVQGSLIKDLAQAGIDHIDILVLSVDTEVHDALAGEGDRRLALEALTHTCQNEVCPMANVALVSSTLATIEETLDDLARRGVRNVGFYALATTEAGPCEAVAADGLPQVAAMVEQWASDADVRYLWYPPVRFEPAVSLAEQVRRGPRTAGDNTIRVQPDGTVIPPRGPFLAAGNLLTDDWEAVRRHDVYRAYRHRLESDTRCHDCPGLAICAADCPRHPAGWASGSGDWAVDGGKRRQRL